MNRCPECGSWGAQCASDTPVKDCGCARCANARAQIATAIESRPIGFGIRIFRAHNGWEIRLDEGNLLFSRPTLLDVFKAAGLIK